jgi:hypothetical protein
MATIERRNVICDTMFYTRLLLACLSIMHGIGSVAFDYGVGLSAIVHDQSHGWLFSAGLIGCSLLLMFSLIGEYYGLDERFCRDMSMSLLAVTWTALFFHSFKGGADTLSLVAPVYIVFCVWAWVREANVARKRKLTTLQRE